MIIRVDKVVNSLHFVLLGHAARHLFEHALLRWTDVVITLQLLLDSSLGLSQVLIQILQVTIGNIVLRLDLDHVELLLMIGEWGRP